MPLPDLRGQPIINKQAVFELKSRQSEGQTLFDKLYSIYVDETPGLVADLRDSVEKNVSGPARETIHQLKGSSAVMGANRIHILAKTTLEYSDEELLAELKGLADTVESEFEQYTQEIASLLDDGQTEL